MTFAVSKILKIQFGPVLGINKAIGTQLMARHHKTCRTDIKAAARAPKYVIGGRENAEGLPSICFDNSGPMRVP